ncbi:hypothetical protein [Halegenticoccus tardaugens]|uniref:hypothetical protein n=1 Tax=Halegenticoccus tardaugens TaxID=2071624 RepID=UPI00100C060D|nr:hypothetical protein [Halegenticoccus tardaugens]
MEPLTNDVVPPSGWTCGRFGRDEVTFRPERWRITVGAKRVPGHGWELRCRESAGEASSVRSLGYVPTREAAIRTLFGCMRNINRTAQEEGPDAPMTLASLAREMSARPEIRPMSADWRRVEAAPSTPQGGPAGDRAPTGPHPDRPWRVATRSVTDGGSDRDDDPERDSGPTPATY